MRNVLHKKEKQKHTLSMAPIEYIGSKQIENSFGRILKTFLLWNCHDDWIVIWYGRNDGHVLMLSCWCCSRKQDGFVVFPIFNIVNFCVRVIILWTFIQASFLFQFQYFTSNTIYILQMKLLYKSAIKPIRIADSTQCLNFISYITIYLSYYESFRSEFCVVMSVTIST